MGRGHGEGVKVKGVLHNQQLRLTSTTGTVLLVVFFSLFPLTITRLQPLATAAVREAPLVSTTTPEGRLAVFDDVWETINSRYYDRTFHGLDWDAQRQIFRAQAMKSQSGAELYAVVRSMIGLLSDPHTRVFAPEEKFDWWRPRLLTIGFAVGEVDGLPTVVRVERDSAADRAGLQAGDVIESVDGKDARVIIRERLATLPQPASVSARFRVFAKLLDGPAETAARITWKTKSGKQKTSQLSRYWNQRELGMHVRRERSDYAVIEIDAFTRTIANTFKRDAAEHFKGARGIILDLRRNGGGD